MPIRCRGWRTRSCTGSSRIFRACRAVLWVHNERHRATTWRWSPSGFRRCRSRRVSAAARCRLGQALAECARRLGILASTGARWCCQPPRRSTSRALIPSPVDSHVTCTSASVTPVPPGSPSALPDHPSAPARSRPERGATAVPARDLADRARAVRSPIYQEIRQMLALSANSVALSLNQERPPARLPVAPRPGSHLAC
jgi:hypothetical protein